MASEMLLFVLDDPVILTVGMTSGAARPGLPVEHLLKDETGMKP